SFTEKTKYEGLTNNIYHLGCILPQNPFLTFFCYADVFDGEIAVVYPQAESSVPALALGDPRGVYTRSCAHSLRCQPSEDETRPLHALLEGRGVCSNQHMFLYSNRYLFLGAERGKTRVLHLILTLTGCQGLHVEFFVCSGFVVFLQCWSSRGKWRGKCWCVDENGTPISADISSSQSC
uniref:Thyroglobulin type-1 domain-containing protein n=1 Tax=Oryzias latipes TaxID=8090 RepID=A0A3P9HW56_ORYLA